MQLDPTQVRQGLVLITDLGAWIARFTPTVKDDQAFALIRMIAETPGVLEEILRLLQKTPTDAPQ